MSDTVTFPEDEPVGNELLPTQGDEKQATQKGERTARAAFKMKIAGATDLEIADQLHYATPAAARVAYENVMAATFDSETDYRSLRRLATARLEAGMKAIAPKALSQWERIPDPKDPTKTVKVANEEHLGYSQMYLRFLDRLIRLQGLDAPQVMQLVTPGVQEIENIVAALTAQARGDDSAEGDIFAEAADGTYEQVVEPEIDPEDSPDEPY